MRSKVTGCAALVVSAISAAPATAQEIRLVPLIDARWRWERVDQDDIARAADALTARVRAGVTARRGRWEALVEAQGTLAIVEQYNSGTNGRTDRPLIIDPQTVDLSRAQLRYATPDIALTAGRQRIELADQRFVGSAAIRQAGQAFDAVRVRWGREDRAFADVTYAWSQRTVNGIDGRGVRQQAVRGDNVFALAGAATPLGLVGAFAYLVDQDEAVVQNFRLSSQTYGVRLAGTVRIAPGATIGYVGSYARQSDWHRNPNAYAADYWLAEATGTWGAVSLTAGHEVLGADDGRALTSVQTPLSSIFRFQGWADKFTTTPPDGIRDLYAIAAVTWRPARLDAAGVSATFHRFNSDRLTRRYGTEWDLLASARKGRTTVSLRYARYSADTFAADTGKLWLEGAWSL